MKGIVWWAAISTCLYLFSVIAAVETETNRISELNVTNIVAAVTTTNHPVADNGPPTITHLSTCSPYWVLVAFVCGVPLGMCIWAVVKRSQANPKVAGGVMGIFFSPPTWRDCVSAIFLTLLVAAPFLILTILCLDYPTARPIWWKMFLTNPGGLFALITGGGTLVGTYIAVQSILEMKHTITSYPQLLDRLREMILDAGESTEGVMFLSYFPLPGSWQAREKLKERLKEALLHRKRRIRVVCLDKQDHKRYVEKIAKIGTEEKGSVSPEEVKDFLDESESVLEVLEGVEAYPPSMIDPPRKYEQFRAKPVRKSYDELPTYYFFVSEHRAIVVMPIGLPQLDENGKAVAARSPISRQISIETLGFETTDRHIIQLLQRRFEEYATPKKPTVAAQETSGLANANDGQKTQPVTPAVAENEGAARGVKK